MLTVNPEFEIHKKVLFQSSVHSAHTSTQELFPNKALNAVKIAWFLWCFQLWTVSPWLFKKKNISNVHSKIALYTVYELDWLTWSSSMADARLQWKNPPSSLLRLTRSLLQTTSLPCCQLSSRHGLYVTETQLEKLQTMWELIYCFFATNLCLWHCVTVFWQPAMGLKWFAAKRTNFSVVTGIASYFSRQRAYASL